MTRTLVNGREGELLNVDDRAFLYGDGLFETLAARDGRPLLWNAHVERLARGCAALGIPVPSAELLAGEAARLCGPEPQAVLRIAVSRGRGGRGYAPPPDAQPARVLSLHDWPAHPLTHWSTGIAAAICELRLARQPRLAGLKHMNRLEQVLARAELAGSDCAEGLMLDTANRVIGGTMSNVFLLRGDELLTPDLGDCGVTGTVRARVLRRAADLRMTVSIRDLSLPDVLAADEMFFTNSIIGLWPVRRIGSRDLPGIGRGIELARTLAAEHSIVLPHA